MVGEPRRVVDAYRLDVAERESREHREAKEERERRFRHKAAETAAVGESDSPAGGVGAGVATEEHVERADEQPQVERWGSRNAEIRGVKLLDVEGRERYHFVSGESVVFEIRVEAASVLDDFVFGVGLFTPRGTDVWGTNTDLAGYEPGSFAGETVVRLVCPALDLAAGEYLIDVAVHSRDGAPYDYHRRLLSFSVTAPTQSVGLYRPQHRWEFDDRVSWRRRRE
jgi:hypothetical protein